MMVYDRVMEVWYWFNVSYLSFGNSDWSHYHQSIFSKTISNRIADSSVQVLVTVVHLSVATLLSSILDVFTPAFIYTNTSDVPLSVWQNDGTMEYGKGGHLILMIVTGVVVGSILTTYLTVYY